MSLVVDASVVVAALIDSGADGVWAEAVLASERPSAPHLMLAEVGNILRRAALAGDVSADAASLAYADLLVLDLDLLPYAPFGERIWALRANLTTYDAWYVAVAEELGAKLATLDIRLSRAAGPRCEFLVPGEASASG